MQSEAVRIENGMCGAGEEWGIRGAERGKRLVNKKVEILSLKVKRDDRQVG